MANKEVKITIGKTTGEVAKYIRLVLLIAGIVGLLWFNHKFLGGHAAIDVTLLILWFLGLSGPLIARDRNFDNYEEAIEYLQKESSK